MHTCVSLHKQASDRLVTKKSENCYEVEITAFLKEPLALQRRIILILLNYLYNDTNTFQSHTLCTSILKMFQTQNGSSMINLPKQFVVSRQYGIMFFEKEQEKTPIAPKELTLNEWDEGRGARVYIGETSRMTAPLSEGAQILLCKCRYTKFSVTM